VVPPPSPPTTASGPYDADPMRPPPPPPEEPHPDDDQEAAFLSSSSSWSGPEASPDFEYCTLFCESSDPGMTCGKYTCSITSDVATSDSQEPGASDSQEPGTNPFHLPETGDPQETDDDEEEEGVDTTEFPNSSEHYTPSSQHYISVQFQFDDSPEEISWVLFDLVANEARVFVDYGAYPKEEYANKLLTIPVTMDGPEMGEKQYVFTVYDEASDGLCCDRGEGYYKVFLGNVEDDNELLGDSVFEFSSSYYFTLFETEDATANLLSQDVTADFQDQNATMTATAESNVTVTSAPTPVPSEEPTSEPTDQPTHPPTRSPTSHPTLSPTTASPTNPWEIQRPEDISAIGARWSVPSKTLPGSFNDVGGDQEKYSLNVDRAMIVSAADIDSSMRGSLAVVVFVCSLFLAIIR